jgi:hypothetical protein
VKKGKFDAPIVAIEFPEIATDGKHQKSRNLLK